MTVLPGETIGGFELETTKKWRAKQVSDPAPLSLLSSLSIIVRAWDLTSVPRLTIGVGDDGSTDQDDLTARNEGNAFSRSTTANACILPHLESPHFLQDSSAAGNGREALAQLYKHTAWSIAKYRKIHKTHPNHTLPLPPPITTHAPPPTNNAARSVGRLSWMH